nr:TnpV protein [uncultured Dysosmobacter sp.]
MKNQSTGLTYTPCGDYLVPNIAISVAATENIGKYGRMRKKYLQEYRPGLYSRLVLSEKLQAHLLEIDRTAHRRLEQMLPALAKKAGATETLKASDPMKWAGMMNTCKAQAEEIVMDELVYN